MSKVYLSKFYIFLIFSLACLSGNAQIKQFTIGIWPEYDKPAVLVYVQVEVDSSNLPMEFELLVPETARSAVKAVVKNGNAEFDPVQLISRDSRTYLPISTKRVRYYGQFYFYPYSNESINKNFDYILEFSEEIHNYTVIIQEHFGSDNFITNLPNPIKENDEYQLIYQKQVFEKLAANNSHLITVKYDNPSKLSSLEKLNEIMLMHTELDEQDNFLNQKHEIYTLYQKLHQNILIVVTGMVIVLFALFRLIKLKKVPIKLFCGKCGEKIKSNTKHCQYCGEKI